jgi:hypothetical protein
MRPAIYQDADLIVFMESPPPGLFFEMDDNPNDPGLEVASVRVIALHDLRRFICRPLTILAADRMRRP